MKKRMSIEHPQHSKWLTASWDGYRELHLACRVSGPIISALNLVLLCVFGSPVANAQVRGVYPLGMTALNSGVTPDAGFTYANQFLFYSRNQIKDTNGEVIATGQQSVMMDMNSFIWVFKKQLGVLGGPLFSFSATLPIANNALTSDTEGALNGGGGFADSYYQPFILGWQKKHADVRVVYGFLAPTGRFSAGADNNVGSGYWTHALSSGQTFYLTQNRATVVSAFQMYEFHTTQQSTEIHPGETLSLDYSITQALSLQKDLRLQVGMVGYEQWQTTDKSGRSITPSQASAHYRVNALGIGANVLSPSRKVSVGARYFREFSNRATYQGYSLQISGAITF
jgi:hypothetical protein